MWGIPLRIKIIFFLLYFLPKICLNSEENGTLSIEEKKNSQHSIDLRVLLFVLSVMPFSPFLLKKKYSEKTEKEKRRETKLMRHMSFVFETLMTVQNKYQSQVLWKLPAKIRKMHWLPLFVCCSLVYISSGWHWWQWMVTMKG